MDPIERQIVAYQSATFDTNGEAWGKTAALAALETFLPDDRVLAFFLSIVANPAEYDMARVHLLKLFEIDPLPEDRQRIGECVAAALLLEKDWMVLCWLGVAVGNYTDVLAARTVAIERALDPSEYLDVRHNCLAGFRGSDSEVVRALRQLAGDESSLGNAARRQLAQVAGT